MKNLISDRVADFLKRYPPFSFIPFETLRGLCEQVVIEYKDKGSTVFLAGHPPKDYFFVVHKGAVTLRLPTNNEIIDICDEGDIFGLRPLMAQEDYKLEATASEESILYAIPIDQFKPFALENREVGDFLIESFASNTRNPYSVEHKGKLWGNEVAGNINPEVKLLDLQPVSYSKKIISCAPETQVEIVARTMSKKKIGAMLVESEGLPIGIITDKDLRNHIATGEFGIAAPASAIMSSPVLTYLPDLTVTRAQMAMMREGISHLCLTEDGTDKTKVVGILSKHDVMVSLGDNPAVLIKAIKRCRKVKQIKRLRKSITHLLVGYLRENLPMGLIAKIITELNDACLVRVIEISLRKIGKPPPARFTWLAMGSQGRSEQMLQTDQDNALIFENVPEDQLPEVARYFLELSELVVKGINGIGYEYCPADMMASNPKWCLSLDEWKNLTARWVINPGADEVLMSSIFFDYSITYGDKELAGELSDFILGTIAKYPIFLHHLAKGALQSPSPTGFFRQFLVEQDGQHKDSFDLKRRGLMPLIDSARVLTLQHGVKGISNTWERYAKLAELEPNNTELFQAGAYATKALVKFRTKQGLAHHDSGRYIVLEQLNKEERVKLKRSFKTIKEIQEVISVRFKVGNLLG